MASIALPLRLTLDKWSVTLRARITADSGRTLRLDAGKVHVVVCDGAPLPIHPSFWEGVGLRVRDADVIVQKNFFHYRMFYATISFKHVPVVSAGATSFEAVRNARYVVPMVPAAVVDDWRPSDPVLRRKKVRASDDENVAAVRGMRP